MGIVVNKVCSFDADLKVRCAEGIKVEFGKLRDVSRSVHSVSLIMMHALRGLQGDEVETFRGAVRDVHELLLSKLGEYDDAIEVAESIALDALS